jgi:hypothetical protein
VVLLLRPIAAVGGGDRRWHRKEKEGENDDDKGFIGAGDERGRASSFLHGHVEQEVTPGMTGSRPKAIGSKRRWRPAVGLILKYLQKCH